MSKVIVLGSLNMDLVIETDKIPIAGETVHGKKFMTNPGGKGANQAVAAAKLGCDVRMVGACGDDVYGNNLINTLNNYNVNTDNIKTIKDCTSGVAVIIKNDNDNRIILDAGANYKNDVEVIKNTIKEIGCNNDIFITQFETNIDSVVAGLKEAKKQGLFTILNPAPALNVGLDIFSYVDLIILNQSEAELISGVYPKTIEECQKVFTFFQDNNIPKTIVTLGSKGSYLFDEGQIYFTEAKKVNTVDTTAAGDSYVGAIAYGLTKGLKLENAVKFATKVSALTVTKEGAQQSIPTLNEVETYFNREEDENE